MKQFSRSFALYNTLLLIINIILLFLCLLVLTLFLIVICSWLKVAVKRIIAGKWGCNNGQACIAPDYIITTKEYAQELVHLVLDIFVCLFSLL